MLRELVVKGGAYFVLRIQLRMFFIVDMNTFLFVRLSIYFAIVIYVYMRMGAV